MSPPTPLPRYIYKILPPHPSPPSPLPLNLPLSPLDAKDGFIHLSTSHQILKTLSLFFKPEPHVWILRIPYESVEKYVKWEDFEGMEREGEWDYKSVEGRKMFPHVYGNGGEGDEGGLKLGREEVEGVGKWTRGNDGWDVAGWPFEEDRPL